MKLQCGGSYTGNVLVRPRKRAWIETPDAVRRERFHRVRPRKRAWIETGWPVPQVPWDCVRPRKRAWIETAKACSGSKRSCRFALARGRGLKLTNRRDNHVGYAGFALARGRGLKLEDGPCVTGQHIEFALARGRGLKPLASSPSAPSTGLVRPRKRAWIETRKPLHSRPDAVCSPSQEGVD